MADYDSQDVDQLSSSLMQLKEILASDPKRVRRDPSVLRPIDKAVAFASAYNIYHQQSTQVLGKITTSNDRLSVAMEEIKRIQREIGNYRESFQEKERSLLDMETRLADSALRLQDLEERDANLRMREESMKEKEGILESLQLELSDHIEKNTGILDTTTSTVSKLEDHIASVSTALSEIRVRETDLENIKTNLDQRNITITRKEAELQDVEGKMAEFREQQERMIRDREGLKELSSKVGSIFVSTSKLMTQFSTRSEEITGHLSNITTILKNVIDSQKALNEKESDLNRIEMELREKEMSLKQTESIVLSRETSLQEKEADFSEIQNEFDQKKNGLVSLEKGLVDLINKNTELFESEADNLRRMEGSVEKIIDNMAVLDKKRDQLTSREEALNSWKLELINKEKLQIEYRENITQLRAERDKLETEISRLHAEKLSADEDHLKEMERKWDDLRKKEEDNLNTARLLASRTERLAEMKLKQDERERSISDREKAIKNFDQEISRKDGKIDDLSEKINEMKEMEATLKVTINTLRSSL